MIKIVVRKCLIRGCILLQEGFGKSGAFQKNGWREENAYFLDKN